MHDAQVNASSWVRRFATLIPKDGVVLDLACGGGRHANFMAQMGYSVLAVDHDIGVISKIQHPLIECKVMDLELEIWPLESLQFSGILVTNYLFRSHLNRLPKMLINGGVLIYETFAQGNAQYGKPSNPDFLLKPGELLSLALDNTLKVLAYEDIYVDEPKPAMIQRLCALKEG